ncbi:hypothetical protein [Pseudonocardia alni]|uniref:hypothetical protein n=1 Tax=Pseudonocardia alni TaxID=33907 RepID=UPI003321F83A
MFESYRIMLDGFTWAWNGETEFPDDEGTSLICTGLDGWHGPPARRSQLTDRPGADGAFRGEAYRGSRTIALEGKHFAADGRRLRTLERRLAGICADPARLYPLRVEDELNPLTAYVELSGEVKVAPTNYDTGVVSLSLTAPDPTRFGDWITSTIPAPTEGVGGVVSDSPGVDASGDGVLAGTAPSPTSITVTNPGSAPAVVVVEIKGPSSSPSVFVTDTGAQLNLAATLYDGESMFINCSTQYAHEVPGQALGTYMFGRSLFGPGGYSGGAGLTVVNGVWPVLPPGGTATFLITGGGPSAVHVRPTYW